MPDSTRTPLTASTVPSDTPVVKGRPARVWDWGLAHPTATVLMAYAAARVVALLTLVVAATWFQNPAGVGHTHPTALDLLPLWDTAWYERIAREGYPVPVPVDPVSGRLTYSAWAFYPLFPYLVKTITVMGVPFIAAGVGVNLILGAAAAVLAHRVLAHRALAHRALGPGALGPGALGPGDSALPHPVQSRLALVAACLWCFAPTTTVMLKPYTEPLAALLVLGSLLLLLQRRYLLVALLAVPLGLTRGVAPAMGVVVLVHLLAQVRAARGAGVRPLAGQRLSALVMLAATAVGGVLWPVVVGVRTGLPTAFFDIQAAWGMNPASGPFVLWVTWAYAAHGLFAVAVLIGVVGTYIALVLGRHGAWMTLELRAWALAYPLYLVAVVRPITSMWRFLLLDIPLAAVVTSVAMRTSTGAAIVGHWRRRVVVVLLLLIASMFWWTSALLAYTPWTSSPP